MSDEGMTRLMDDIRGMVRGAEGDPNVVMTAVGEEFKRNPSRIFAAWGELAGLGSEERPRVQASVDWARGVVNDSLQRLGLRTGEPWRNLVPVSRGIVDLLATEVQNYRRERRPKGRQ